ncbi:MAG: helix-turn-helix transcriptional regulator [Rhizobiaceae bacterium]|nr:helix-turn-helix transcriptional regulator [Rhizobiaceae bacterium]
MTRRAEAAARKRDAILQATLEAHAERGVEKTGWDDIASRAGVGVGTVYRHFPDLDALLPACGELTFRKLDLPGPDIFDGAADRAERIARLVSALFALYERGEPELRNIRNERDYHPALAEAHEQVERRLAELVEAAVETQRPLVRALVDLGMWQALREAGVAMPAEAMAAVIRDAVGGR